MPARRCSCDYCRRFDGAWTSHPDARLAIRVHDESGVTRYRFGTKTADFIFCSRCGVTLFAVCELQHRLRGVVNVHTLSVPAVDGQEPSFVLDWQSACFDGETVEQRLQRRAERWIGIVNFV